jgi:phosphotriesterase-related protein
MGTIETARGPIASDRLGPTLMHEHVFVIDLALEASFDTDFDEEPAVVNAVRRLTELKAAGIDTIVDPTVLGIGRNPPLVQRVAEQVDLNIVLATGVFTTNELPQYFHYRHMLRPPEQGDVLVELFVRDIREGIKGTDGAKAAILKCAIDTPGLTADVERVLRATAVAHRETGVPITTHTDAAGRGGLEQQRILAEEGVDLSRVIIGHCGDTDDIDYLEELLRNGSLLGLDRFGADRYMPVDDRVAMVLELCERRLGGPADALPGRRHLQRPVRARVGQADPPALALRAHPARGAAGAARARHAGGDDPDDDGRHAAPAARPPGWILSRWSSSRSAGCSRR